MASPGFSHLNAAVSKKFLYLPDGVGPIVNHGSNECSVGEAFGKYFILSRELTLGGPYPVMPGSTEVRNRCSWVSDARLDVI
jgi:hypothetical protein